MNYEKWADEYLVEAEQLRERVTQLKAQLKTAGCNQSNELNRRIAMLYGMYLECRHTGHLLKAHPATLRQRAEQEGIVCSTNN